jgi:hypothetical protein
MAKFKVGDKVLIKKDITADETCIRSQTLEKFKNEPMTIKIVYGEEEAYDVEENYYSYEGDWLELYEDRDARKFEAFLREVADGYKRSTANVYHAYDCLYNIVNHDNLDNKYYLTDEEFELSISDLVNFYVNEFVPEKDKPAVEMTLSEVEKALGHKVKIVPDEKEETPWE